MNKGPNKNPVTMISFRLHFRVNRCLAGHFYLMLRGKLLLRMSVIMQIPDTQIQKRSLYRRELD